MVLVEYTWEQNSAGQVRNTVGRVLTESGWREFESYAMMAPDMPTISGLDMVRQMALDKKLEQWERWIASMIDFGNQSELAQQEQQEHQNPQDDEDGGQRIVSHDRPVPTPVPDETPEATPADNQQPERTVTDD